MIPGLMFLDLIVSRSVQRIARRSSLSWGVSSLSDWLTKELMITSMLALPIDTAGPPVYTDFYSVRANSFAIRHNPWRVYNLPGENDEKNNFTELEPGGNHGTQYDIKTLAIKWRLWPPL